MASTFARSFHGVGGAAVRSDDDEEEEIKNMRYDACSAVVV